LSAKTFEQIELSLRVAKGTTPIFGGIQVILVLDPRQLPPVPDAANGDDGRYCFESHLWPHAVPHMVHLNIPHRQQDPHLLQLVEDTFSGQVSPESENLLRWLERPHDPHFQGKITYLAADNFTVERRNRAALDLVPGEMTLYTALDSGDPSQLSRIKVPKVLALKPGCRVMLLQNLDQHKGLVNGTQGTVVSLEADTIKVDFRHHIVAINRHVFSRYSPQSQMVLAKREQFPLCLAYALTIHKAQGQELPAVEVDARGATKSGSCDVITLYLVHCT